LIVVKAGLFAQDIVAPEGPAPYVLISSLFTRVESGVPDLPAPIAGRSGTPAKRKMWTGLTKRIFQRWRRCFPLSVKVA